MKDIVIKVGQKAGEWILVSVLPYKGTFISTSNSNRYDDEMVSLDMNHDLGLHTLVSRESENVPVEYFRDLNIPKVEPIKPPEKGTLRLYRHLRPEDNHNLKGVTFAIELDYNSNEVRYGYALCNGDNFMKEIGRKMALERLVHNPRTLRVGSLFNALQTYSVIELIGHHVHDSDFKLFVQIDKILGEYLA